MKWAIRLALIATIWGLLTYVLAGPLHCERYNDFCGIGFWVLNPPILLVGVIATSVGLPVPPDLAGITLVIGLLVNAFCGFLGGLLLQAIYRHLPNR